MADLTPEELEIFANLMHNSFLASNVKWVMNNKIELEIDNDPEFAVKGRVFPKITLKDNVLTLYLKDTDDYI